MGESWAERIPAAIAEAERCIEGYEWTFVCVEEKAVITKAEVALAKALWEDETIIRDEWSPRLEDWPKCPALRAFCEKVEAL